jgi:TolB-like protein/tetratricopeptide (TPR) repeat protein
MGFLVELKRRKVFRVAAVYAATGFVVVEAADIMLPRLGVPEWAVSLVVVLVVLGLPVALVLAWALELTPDGVRVATPATDPAEPPPSLLGRRTAVLAGSLVILGTGLGAGWFLSPTGGPAGPTVDVAAAGSPGTGSIAVLPFLNMSADPGNEYFAEGIAEELLNVLVRVEGLGVASRTSSFAYKGREIGAVAIARELNVGHILEGSVRKEGNRVRVAVQLIDAVNDRHLWAETYDRELTGIFEIQDEIANAIVAALQGTLGTDQVARTVTVRGDTENLDAYELYLKARALFVTRTNLPESVRLFEQVVELDPEFARGWEGLAGVTAVIESWGIQDRDYSALARQAADRALALDPSLSMPWAVHGLVAMRVYPVDYARALDMYDRAIAADPANASTYLWRGIAWVNLGFFDRAMADQDRCLTLDPAYENCRRWKALTMLFTGDVDTALELFEEGLIRGFRSTRGSSFVEPLFKRHGPVTALLLMQDLDEPIPHDLQHAILAVLAGGDPPDNARALVERDDVAVRLRPYYYLLLRRYDLAAAADGLTTTTVAFWDPAYAGLRGSPAFKQILERLGIAAYWRQHGHPPQCRPRARDDFDCA